ncbi:MobA protein [Sulfitobacter noctilucae]|nr:MobA protein [Sulfitobacter noctilucae]
MLIKFFPHGKGGGAGPVNYLVANSVLAHDKNRNLIRDTDGLPMTVARDPRPEVLRGNSERTKALIDAICYNWTYRAGVISFASEDAPSEAQQAEVMGAFEQLAFAGLDGEQYDILWVRHSHQDRVELHFCSPRLELTSGRSLNVAPPGYQDAYDSLRDLMNHRHGWADPMELERAQVVRDTSEAPTRAQGRDELHAWVLDQISLGMIQDRATMVEAFTEAGFSLPRVSKAYLTVQDPETSERWRLKGEIFHEHWQADPAERKTECRAGNDTQRLRRLDGIPVGELQLRFDGHCERRAAYHRKRYAPLSTREQELLRDPDRTNQALADDLALGHFGTIRDGDRLDDGRELVLDARADACGAVGTRPDSDRPGRTNLAHARPRQDHTEHLQTGRQTGLLHPNFGGINDGAIDSIGARFAHLRRAVGDGVRDLSRSIERLRSALDEEVASSAGWYRSLHDVAHALADQVAGSVTWLTQRRSHLQRAGRAVAEELELSEGRRRKAAKELTRMRPYGEQVLPVLSDSEKIRGIEFDSPKAISRLNGILTDAEFRAPSIHKRLAPNSALRRRGALTRVGRPNPAIRPRKY